MRNRKIIRKRDKRLDLNGNVKKKIKKIYMTFNNI